MLFFALLPSDLHICILQTWIGCDHSDSAGSDGQLLRALSALDIACCSAKHRKPCWLELADSLRLRGMMPILEHTMSYLLWLSSRAVAVRCLVLDRWRFKTIVEARRLPEAPCPELPAVSELVISQLAHQLALGRVLSCCPNLTSLRNAEPSAAALLACGQHLIKLELDLDYPYRTWNCEAILTVLPQACPLLEASLSLSNCVALLPALLTMRRACKHLTELKLKGCNLSTVYLLSNAQLTEAAAIILKGCQLTRFTMWAADHGPGELVQQSFVQLLGTHPELDYLEFQSCCYCRSNRYLQYIWETEAGQADLLRACLLVNPLRTLSLRASVAPHLFPIVLSQCPALEGLEISFFHFPRDMPSLCNAVTVHCKLLRSLDLGRGCCLTDDDAISLLTSLRCLKELKLYDGDLITIRTLQAIVDNKCCLGRFCYDGRCKYERDDEVAQFTQLAKAAGMLPVPKVEPYVVAGSIFYA